MGYKMITNSKNNKKSLIGNKSKEEVEDFIYELIPGGSFEDIQNVFDALMGVIENEFDQVFYEMYPKADRNPLFYP